VLSLRKHVIVDQILDSDRMNLKITAFLCVPEALT
jgi:hypothetical protein